MTRRAIEEWVMGICGVLRKSQRKTLAELVFGLIGAGRVGVVSIGRGMAGQVCAKHCIKRVDRFLGNTRVAAVDGMRAIVRQVTGRMRKPLVVALDWVDVRQYKVLVAGAVWRGRAVPLVWGVYEKWELFKSQNRLELGLLRLLREIVGQAMRVIVIADRGFGRAELARELQELGWFYVIRVQPTVWISSRQHTGPLTDLPVRPGMATMLRATLYRKRQPVEQDVVIKWQRGTGQPWFLMTNLKRPAEAIAAIYAKRMKVEQLFRDQKNTRNGFALRQLRITNTERLERLLLVAALAYLILVAVGLACLTKLRPGAWCSNSRVRACSPFTIGKEMYSRIYTPLARLIADLCHSLQIEQPKWG